MKKTSYNYIRFSLPGVLTFLSLIFFTSVIVPSGVFSQNPVKIMILGNSIANGDGCLSGDIYACNPRTPDDEEIGFRKSLFDQLTAAGHTVDFVGSEQSGGSLMTDTDHAGFPAIRDNQLADIMETGTSSHASGTVAPGAYLNSYPADIIILHIGTNDVLALDYTVTDVERILNAVDLYEGTSGNHVRVYVAKIISQNGFPCGTHPGVTTFNTNLQTLVNARIASGDDLVLIDMECTSGIDYNADFVDQVHPNDAGWGKMADTWYAPVESYVSTLEQEWTLTMQAPTGSGSVSPAEGSHTYSDGASVSLSATPDAGWSFAGWSGSISSTDNPASLSMDADKTVKATFTQNIYTLTVSTDGTTGSSVSPSGATPVNHGAATAISATTPAGYNFTGWSVTAGSGVSFGAQNSANTTVTLTGGSATIQANYSQIIHTLTMQTPTGTGTVSPTPGNHTYPEGNNATLTATPGSGWSFSTWSGDYSGSDNPASLAMDSDKTVKATFTLNNYDLTVSDDGTAGASTSPSGTSSVGHGVATAISATAPAGYDFNNWTVEAGNDVSIASPASVSTTVTLSNGDGEVRANFSLKSYSLTVNHDGTAGASTNPSGVSSVNHGASTAISATTPAGYTFTGWTVTTGTGVSFGNSSASSTTVILSAEDAVIQANFSLKNYTLTVTNDGTTGASTTPDGNVNVSHGLSQAITASVPSGYSFDGWTVTAGTGVSFDDASSASTNVTLTDGNATILASFIPVYQLTVNVNGGGTVARNPDQSEYESGTVVQLTPQASDGYNFYNWTGDAAGDDNPLSITMNGNKVVNANFNLKSYFLNTATDGTAGASTDPNGTISVLHGASTSIEATSPPNYHFSNWSVSSGLGVVFANANLANTNVTLTNGNADILANFEIDSYTLTVQDDGTAGASTSPSGDKDVDHGVAENISATVPAGYSFTGWSVAAGSGVSFGNSALASTTVTLTEGAATIQANYSLNSYNLTLTTDGTSGSSVSPSGPQSVDHGVATNISAVIPAGYNFAGWTATSGTGVSFADENSASTTVTLTGGDATIKASFALKTYTLTLTTDGTAGSSTTPSGSAILSHGVSTNISATVPTGYNFTGWTVTSGTGVSFGNQNIASTTLTLTSGAATIKANYSLKSYTLSVSDDGTAGASVSPANDVSVNHGAATAIEATAPVGYEFTDWSVVNGTGVSFGNVSQASTTVSLTDGDAEIKAGFALKSYTLRVTTDGTAGASVNPSGNLTVSHGVATSIVATIPEGYLFTGWTVVSGTNVSFGNSALASTTVTLAGENAVIRATFAIKTYTLNVSDDGTTGATTTPDGNKSVDHGAAENITATVPNGYSFKNWSVESGTGVSFGNVNQASTTVTLTSGNASIRANYSLDTYILTVTDDNTPGVVTNPDGSVVVDHNAEKSISTNEPAGYEFNGWSITSGSGVDIANSGQLNTTVTLTEGDATVRAEYEILTYILKVRDDGTAGASVSPSVNTTVDHGADTPISAVVPTGYNFAGWTVTSGNGVSFGNNALAVTTVRLTDGGATIQANFEKKVYQLSVTNDGTAGALTEPDGDVPAEHGTAVNIASNEPAGYTFSGWTVVAGAGVSFGNALLQNTTVTLTDGDAEIKANYTLNTYTLTVEDDGTAGASANPAGDTEVDHGVSTSIEATAPEGYRFTSWSLTSGTGVSFGNILNAETTVTLTDGDATIQANFELKSYTLTPGTDGTPGAATTPLFPVAVDHGVSQSIEATVPSAYNFLYWTTIVGSGVQYADSTQAETNVTLTGGHATIQATYEIKKYNVNSAAGPNGTIIPLGDSAVDHGSDISFTFVPDEGYEVDEVIVDGSSIVPADNYTFGNVTEEHTLFVNFVIKKYTVSPTAGLHGSVSPDADTLVEHGGEVSFTFIPDEGYEVEDVLVDGVSEGPLEDYTFTDVTEEHSIDVSFVIQTFTINAVAGNHGTIVPAGDTEVDFGDDQEYLISADEGYEISSLVVDSVEIDTASSYTFTDVRRDHTIEAGFTIKKYIISSSAGLNGGIDPEGDTEVEHFSSQSYTFTPDEGYEIAKVVVDGDSVGIMSQYTFENIDSSHTISVDFVLKTYTINASAGLNGTIDPPGETETDHGSDLEYTITPRAGYEISEVIVDGASVGSPQTYSFLNITDNHTIEVEFIKYIEVIGVSIPDTSMKIGDHVTADIYLTTDAGNPYSLVSGEIAGYTLANLIRVDSSHYTAEFTVTEGGDSYNQVQNIPVTNLILTDTEVQNLAYQGSIIQSNDPLDAERPVITFVWVENGNRKVGETVRLYISADGTGYTLDPLSLVNGVPASEDNISFMEVGNGNYSLSYVVLEGDNDVEASELQAKIVLVKPSGNKNLPYSIIDNISNLTIDANSPVVSGMVVPAGEFGIGDVVQVTITADGTGYLAGSGTFINEIPLSSPRVSFTEQGNGVYILSYTVAMGDNGVETGELDLSVVVVDGAGNEGGPFTRLEPNSLSVYTELPTATIGGSQTICQGEETELTVILTGRPPFSIYLSNGEKTTEYTDIYTSPFNIEVQPFQTTTYNIDLVSDVKGTLNSGSGSGLVTVNPKTDVEFINLKKTFSIESEPVVLQANVTGGTFTGPGVNSTTGIFDPAAADTLNSPHMIYYTYQNVYGCVSMDSALIFVLGAQGDIFIPSSFYCNYQDPFTVNGSNIAEVNGSFSLLNNSGTLVEGITDNGDNTASINPGVLADGTYTIEYSYFDGVDLYIRENFRVESVEDPVILGPQETDYCQNDLPVDLTGSVSGAVFEGPGVSGNTVDGFVFDPSRVDPGNLEITLTNTSQNGCVSSVSKEITVNQLPELFFVVDKFCVSNRDTVFFSNITADKYLVDTWEWNFDDPLSGEKNNSSDEAPWHIYNQAGERSVTLKGITAEGCIDSIQRVIDFGDNPSGSFTWDSECFTEGTNITLTSEMSSSNAISSYTWTIVDTAGTEEVISGGESIDYTFTEMNPYTIRLNAETVIGCAGMAEREIVLKPVINLSDEVNYFEDFTANDGWWSAYQEDSSEFMSWDYKVVNFTNMGDSLSRGWVTRLPDSQLKEYSYVNSPCFNFSDIDKPMISLNISRSLEENSEGAYMEVTTDGGKTWELLGDEGEGIKWYNSSEIQLPAQTKTGWTGTDPFKADEGWVNARHTLDFLKGEEEVQFRMAFVSDHSSEETEREGFAFDDVSIGNRSRKVLLEHFTNSASSATREVDGVVNNIYNSFFNDMVKLEYHTSFPGNDPFNSHNSAVPATRSLYYGVSSVPYSVVNGGYNSALKFDFLSETIPDKEVLESQYLKEADFDIQILTETGVNQITADVELTSNHYLEAGERIIYIVIYEKRITGISTLNGATNFLNVVKDILPNSAGIAVFDEWYEGQSRNYQYTWNFENVYNPEMIRVAAFIQDDNTREVYQAEANDQINLTTDVDQVYPESINVEVYPNPAEDYIYLNIEAEDKEDYIYEVYDQTGRVVLRDFYYSWESLRKIGLERFNKGVYYIRIKQQDNRVLKTEKIILMN